MAHSYRILIALLFCSPAFAQSVAPIGSVDLAGWIKNESGTYTKAFDDAKVTLNSPPQGIKTTSTALVQTSKGLQNFDIEKLSTVDVSRVGKAVRGLAVLGGPAGMAVTAVSLVCELTTICNQAGQWITSADPSVAGYPTTTGNVHFCQPSFCLQTRAPTKEIACSKLGPIYSTSTSYNSGTDRCVGTGVNEAPQQMGGCAPGYALSGSTCTLTSNPDAHPTTPAEWDAKQNLLNDNRFVPELIEKGVDVPTGIPTLIANQKKGLGLESTPTKDAQGNVTGREDTTTEIEAVEGATAESPGRVIIKENKTTIKYDTNNTQISSTTSTSYAAQPQADKPQQAYEIKFDEVPPATLPTYSVPNTFASTSWGSGTCPPDIEVATSNITFSIPTEPVCDTAEMINPFVLLLSSLIGIYIISGVRGASAA